MNNDERRVLICDDNPDIREFIETALIAIAPADLGFQTVTVDNGEAALQAVVSAIQAGHPFCMAFVDQRMPVGWSGVETAARIRQQDPEIEIVIITAYDDLGRMEGNLDSIGSPEKLLILKKPLSLEEVIQTALNLSEKWRLEKIRRQQDRELADAHESLKRSYMEMERTHKVLVESEKMAGIGRLASGVAHEFNNILTGVLGHAQLALASDEPGEMREALNAITELGWRAKRIVDGLLNFARKKPRRVRRGNLQQVLENVINLAEKSGNRPIVHIHRQYQEIPDSEFDHDQVAQVFLNLLLNARQAAIGDEVNITVGTRVEGDMIKVFVLDDGKGIEADVLPRVFEPFFTTKGALGGGNQGGTGLGLSIAQGIVREHGGDIQVYSTPGQGTEFVVSFPISSQVSIGVNDGHEPPMVMVVDGDRVVSSLVRDMLEDEGMRVEFGQKDDIIKEPWRLEGYSVLIIDPVGMDTGILSAVLDKIVTRGTRVLLTPAKMDYGIRELEHSDGILVLEKPYTPRDLSTRIKDLFV